MDRVFDWMRALSLPFIVAIIMLALVVISFRQCSAARTAGTEARTAAAQGEAGADNAKDAIATVGAASGREAQVSTITEENRRDIQSAPGADAPVSPAVAAAGRRGLCRHASYRGRPECVQQPAAR